MNIDTSEDVPSQLTALLRTVNGVHTVYATKSLVPTLITEVIELVTNEPVGLHLVTVAETDEGVTVDVCIGISALEPAFIVARRAHDAVQAFFIDRGDSAPRCITVKIGRVG